MKRSILIIALFVLTLFSCDYDYVPYFEAPKPQIELQDLPAYAHFKTGTYWIYKDSASGVEDSVYVYYDTLYSYYQNNGLQDEGIYMFYYFSAHSYLDSYDYTYRISMGNYSVVSGATGVERIKRKPTDYVGDTYLMHNKFVDQTAMGLYTGTGVTYFKRYYDSINIGANMFYSTSKFFDTNNETEFHSPTNFYIAKNIGIIRKERADSSIVWNLIRYHIIQ
ncbi:MAG: hypothetical protein J0L87_02915 [Bacteroidetes bacterium]|nr:hypothetical protein [Bacteroidota bacterium]